MASFPPCSEAADSLMAMLLLSHARWNDNDDVCEPVFAAYDSLMVRLGRALCYRDEEGQHLSVGCVEAAVNIVLAEMNFLSKTERQLAVGCVNRLNNRLDIEPAALILAVIYLRRLDHTRIGYNIDTNNLFTVALMVASKFLLDTGEAEDASCSEWADAAMINCDRLKKLEITFLTAISWQLMVTDKEFENQLVQLEKCVVLDRAAKRVDCGLNYIEAMVLLQDVDLAAIVWEQVALGAFKMTLVCMTAYLTSITATLATLHTVHQMSVLSQDLFSIKTQTDWSINATSVFAKTTNLPEMMLDDDIEEGSVRGIADLLSFYENKANILSNDCLTSNSLPSIMHWDREDLKKKPCWRSVKAKSEIPPDLFSFLMDIREKFGNIRENKDMFAVNNLAISISVK